MNPLTFVPNSRDSFPDHLLLSTWPDKSAGYLYQFLDSKGLLSKWIYNIQHNPSTPLFLIPDVFDFLQSTTSNQLRQEFKQFLEDVLSTQKQSEYGPRRSASKLRRKFGTKQEHQQQQQFDARFEHNSDSARAAAENIRLLQQLLKKAHTREQRQKRRERKTRREKEGQKAQVQQHGILKDYEYAPRLV